VCRILYVEDEPWQVKNTVITVIEKELQYTVDLAGSVTDAKEALSTTKYDVVFLDVMLDRTKGVIELENSGLSIARMILGGIFAAAGNPPTLPIIIASGVWDTTVHDEDGNRWVVEDIAKSLGIPRDNFLRKPFLSDEVQKMLKSLVGE